VTLVIRKSIISAVLDLFCSNEKEWKSHFVFDRAFIPPEELALQPLVLSAQGRHIPVIDIRLGAGAEFEKDKPAYKALPKVPACTCLLHRCSLALCSGRCVFWLNNVGTAGFQTK
jgi:hypothetical protein